MIAVCGASGKIGSRLIRKLDIYKGTYLTKETRSSTIVDFLDPADIHTFLTGCSKCVWLVGTSSTDWYIQFTVGCVMAVNAYKVCEILGIPFVWLSTTEVFDGLSPPYYPESSKNPITNFGKVKAACETFLTNAITIRVPRVIFEPFSGPQNAISTTQHIHIDDLIDMVLSIDTPGLYNFEGPSQTDYEYGIKQGWDVTRIDTTNRPLDLTTCGQLSIPR